MFLNFLSILLSSKNINVSFTSETDVLNKPFNHSIKTFHEGEVIKMLVLDVISHIKIHSQLF